MTLPQHIDWLAKQAMELTCEDQHELAQRIAANVGYTLVPEITIQDSEDRHHVLERLARLESAVLELNPGLNW